MGNWTPSIVPKGDDENVYLVLGRCWRETNIETTDLETVIADLQDGHYANPARIVSFNAVEGWSRDVSRDIAHELRRRSICNGGSYRLAWKTLSAGSQLAITSSSR